MKFEEYDGREVLVHRKDATRGFDPGSEELPERYRSVGQPVLVEGDMGRYSFILAGTEGAMSETSAQARTGRGARWAAGRQKGSRKVAPQVGAGGQGHPDTRRE